jgi:hypothetical protein
LIYLNSEFTLASQRHSVALDQFLNDRVRSGSAHIDLRNIVALLNLIAHPFQRSDGFAHKRPPAQITDGLHKKGRIRH